MSHTKYFTEHVEINIGLDEWEDEELIDEVKARGYTVEEDSEFTEIIRRWSTGDRKEALFLLERELPELRGISQLIN